MNDISNYKYHCQHQALSFARAILDFPDDYPLKNGLPADFPSNFRKLCKLAKNIYTDMSKRPESYSLMLVDIESSDHNLSRDGYRTIHRFVDTLSNLSRCSELNNHRLKVNTEAFCASVKKGSGFVSGPVPKYELILSRLEEFGFVFSGFENKPFNKKAAFFEAEYPENPEIIDTIKSYFEAWEELKNNREKEIKVWAGEYHHHFYRFDYKITADREKIPLVQWVSDEADYLGFSPEQKLFSIEFYKYSLKYGNVKFDGDYNYKSKRIARIWQSGYTAVGKSEFLIHIKIKNMDRFMTEIEAMPQSIKKVFTQSNCRYCGFQGATEEKCKYRIYWTFDGKNQTGCSHACFYFDDFSIERIPDYWKLLEMEYGLK